MIAETNQHISLVARSIAGATQSRAAGRLLGEELVAQGKLKPDDIARILARQAELTCTFGQAAVELGLLKQADISIALARQFHYPISESAEFLRDVSRELVIAHEPFSEPAERIRSIRAALLHRWLVKPRRSLAVVGAHRDAGATYLAANLAVSFAQMGLSTVLVEADLRQPRLAKMFHLTGKRPSLSSILTTTEGNDSYTFAEVLPSLTIIEAGVTPPNPLELLSSRSFLSLAEALKDRYEVVIYDTPSDQSLADASVICGRAGAALVVARRNRTQFDSLKRLMRLRDIGCELVGAVLNSA